MPFENLEDAQTRILELEEELTQKNTQIETLSNDKKNLEQDIEKVRTLNQNLFNRLIVQSEKKDDKKDEHEDVKTCEEFAKTLEI